MFGKIIGAFVGDKIAKQTSGIGGASGAALGVIAATAIRRLSLPAMIALGAGGYAVKKVMEKREREKAAGSEANEPQPEVAARKAA
ncbi:MAG: hypothetical protein R3E14_03735 [Erythrobacter sp.]